MGTRNRCLAPDTRMARALHRGSARAIHRLWGLVHGWGRFIRLSRGLPGARACARTALGPRGMCGGRRSDVLALPHVVLAARVRHVNLLGPLRLVLAQTGVEVLLGH